MRVEKKRVERSASRELSIERVDRSASREGVRVEKECEERRSETREGVPVDKEGE